MYVQILCVCQSNRLVKTRAKLGAHTLSPGTGGNAIQPPTCLRLLRVGTRKTSGRGSPGLGKDSMTAKSWCLPFGPWGKKKRPLA